MSNWVNRVPKTKSTHTVSLSVFLILIYRVRGDTFYQLEINLGSQCYPIVMPSSKSN